MSADNLHGIFVVISLSLNYTTTKKPHKLRLMAALDSVSDLSMEILFYGACGLAICFAALGSYHLLRLIWCMAGATKIPHYGIEILFVSEKELSNSGIMHRNKVRGYFVLFLVTGLLTVYLYKSSV